MERTPSNGSSDESPNNIPTTTSMLDQGLPQAARQEQFSIGFVHLVASAAGCSLKIHYTDYDGVDLTVSSSAQYARVFGPQFELQLKCTRQHKLLTPDHMTWRLKAKQFEKLTRKRYIPAYLGVLLIPADPELLLQHDESRLVTESCLYWERGDRLGHMDGAQNTTLVKLPRSNIFTVEQLLGIMERLSEEGDW